MVLVVIKERERVKEREEGEVFLLLLFAERGGEKRGERRRDVKKERRGGKMDEMRVVFSSFLRVSAVVFGKNRRGVCLSR